MRIIIPSFVLLTTLSCVRCSAVGSDYGLDPRLIGRWHVTDAVHGDLGSAAREWEFRKDGTLDVSGEELGYQAHPPYIIIWRREDMEYQAPNAIYYEFRDEQFYLVTDVGIYLYRKGAPQPTAAPALP